MDAETAVKGWRLANPAERAQLYPVVMPKIAGSKTLSVERKRSMIEEMQGTASNSN